MWKWHRFWNDPNIGTSWYLWTCWKSTILTLTVVCTCFVTCYVLHSYLTSYPNSEWELWSSMAYQQPTTGLGEETVDPYPNPQDIRQGGKMISEWETSNIWNHQIWSFRNFRCHPNGVHCIASTISISEGPNFWSIPIPTKVSESEPWHPSHDHSPGAQKGMIRK